MELEVFGEDVLTEPDFRVCIEQSLVIVVSDATSILHLANHVSHGRPRYALRHTEQRQLVNSLEHQFGTDLEI